MEAGTQGQGRGGGWLWGPLCRGRPSSAARPLSAQSACAKSSDPWPGELHFRTPWKLPVRPRRGADIPACVTFAQGLGATQGPPSFADIAQKGS